MRIARWFPVAVACLLSACATNPSTRFAAAEEAHVAARVQELLNKYQANDQAGVAALLDSQLLVLGSSITEKIHTSEQLKSLMASDFRSWGKARFSDVRDMDVRIGSDLATAYFLMSFQAGDNPSIPIRVTTTWRKRKGEWFLTQSANTVMSGR